MKTIQNLKDILRQSRGFTLLEIIIVLVIISIMTMLIIPRISNLFDSKRSNFIVLTTIIAKTFDDSFINDRLNFLVLHLYEPLSSDDVELFSRTNGISVVNLNEDGQFVGSRNRLLKYKAFPDSFKLEEIILSTGEKIGMGNVLIPFYPDGYSDDVIIHILVNDEERWSVRIYKLKKEARIFPEYIDF